MSTYTLESDKIFLHCLDVGVVEVYEIESLEIAFLEKKHWKNLPTINFGRNKEYEVLKIGDREIKGRDLKRVMEDLVDSQLLVNREGLCILPTEKITHDFDVEYYRIFDLFDWSKHEAKSTVKTRWSRSDVLSGDSMPDAEGERYKKMEGLLKQYEKELAIVKESLKEYKENLVMTKDKIEELEKELTMRVYEHSDQQPTIFVSSVIDRVRTSFTAISVSGQQGFTMTGPAWSSALSPGLAMVLDIHLTKNEMETLVDQKIELKAPYEGDSENWWAVKICGAELTPNRKSGIFVYYDGTKGYQFKYDHWAETIPLPVNSDSTNGMSKNEAFIYLLGLGPRYGCFFPDTL